MESQGGNWLECRDTRLQLGKRTIIMGILNITPDSFSDGGAYADIDAAVARATQMAEEGADIIDVGGESTRPGATAVSEQEELRRVIPVIKAISRAVPLPLSIDTYKANVAREALAAGAHIINDIWGCKKDSDMARVAADSGCPIVLMHNRREPVYEGDLLAHMLDDLQQSVQLALEAGVAASQIVLDPGIGFGKTVEHNLEAMGRLGELRQLGYPLLLGTSRKSFIYKTLGLPASDVVEGTAATVALGIAQGCEIMRVHDVRQMKRVALMCDAIVRREG